MNSRLMDGYSPVQSTPLSRIRSIAYTLSASILIISGLHAAGPSWTYNPPAAARALYSGGWVSPYNLGQVNASPEFNFPLQLVYYTGREQDGIFGSQWFCPQLESSLMPVAKGFLLWTMTGSDSQPSHIYGWLDKLTCAGLPGGATATHTYWPDGQLAAISSSQSSSSSSQSTIQNPRSSSISDSFLWDGLALIKRNDTIYLIESHPSGGIPIASHPVGKPEEITYHLNDLLGTTLATAGPAGVNFASLTSFGQPLKASTSSADPGSPHTPSAPEIPVPSTNQLPPTRQ